jgi:hypothetical protein
MEIAAPTSVLQHPSSDKIGACKSRQMGKLCLKPRRGYKLAQAAPVLSLWFFPASHEGGARRRGAESAGAVLRWLHVIAGIAWIGSSFYFIHLVTSSTSISA